MIWHCPLCHAELRDDEGALVCGRCSARFEVVAGIPDLRVPGPAWVDYEVDRAAARRLAAETEAAPLEAMIRRVFRGRPGWDEPMVARRTRQVLDAPARLRDDVTGWLRPVISGGGFLDVGCGHGALLAAAAAEGWNGVGIDVSLEWLVVARRLIELHGGRPVLAAALGEALPFAAASLPAVVALDVIEHVADLPGLLREIGRVTVPGGGLAIATPNRFSLAAEPHVGVWGVGWLPRQVQRRYAEWRSGRPYRFVRLVSAMELRRLVRRHTAFAVRLVAPPVPPEEIAHFPAWRAALARSYNRLASLRWLRPALLALGPFFRIVAVKQPRRDVVA